MTFITKVKEKVSAAKEKGNIFVERPQLNVFIKLFYIILKNLKLLIRSKLSALIFFFGPLLIVFLLVLTFNTSTLYDLNVATYSDSYTTMSEDIINNLSDSQYNVLKLDSEEDCIDAVKYSDFQVCLIFPSGMVVDNSANNNIISIYVDNSRLNVATLISSQISTKVSVEASELSEDIITEILTVLDTTNQEVVSSEGKVDSLISSSSSLASSVSGISSDLDSLDFSFTTVDTTLVTAEIDSLNLSSSATEDLETAVGTLVSAYSGVISTLSSVEDGVDDVSSSATSAAGTVSSGSEDLEEVSESLNVVINSIDTIKITNVENIISPVKTSIESISSNSSYLFYILPSILVMVFMFVSILMSSSSIIDEKMSRAHFRNFITPTNSLLFLVGGIFSNLLVLFVQVGIIMGLLYYFFADLGWQMFVLAGGFLLLLGTFFILLGILIGYLFNTKQTVTLASLSIALIMLFFSNVLLPLETVSSYLRNIIAYNPFVLGESVLKRIFLFSSGFAEVAFLIYVLIGITFLTFVLTMIIQKISKRNTSV
jgi:ABC-type multidrug transport system permease subunit